MIPAIIVWDSVAATTSTAAAEKVEKEGLDAVNVAPHLEDAYLCLLKDFV